MRTQYLGFLLYSSCIAGCTTVLGIDVDYALEKEAGVGTDSSTSGGSESGGAGSGGSESGGIPGSGGSAGAGLSGSGGDSSVEDAPTEVCGLDGSQCLSGKCCFEVCVTPAPIVGCSLTGCDPCPPPPDNGVAICSGDQCAVRCNDGYDYVGGTCVPNGDSGGNGGSGGTDSGSGTGGISCDPAGCTGCISIIGQIACCRHDETCGCMWPGTSCY